MQSRLALLGLGLLAAFGLGYGVLGVSDAAWTDQVTNPGTAVTADQVGQPGQPVSTLNPNCTNITVEWTAAALADDYRVEAWTATTGTFTTVTASTSGNLTWADTTDYTNDTVRWRVIGIRSGTSWESVPSLESADRDCGIPPVIDLAVTETCGARTLTWSHPTATRFNIRRRVNAGGWTNVQTNLNAFTWTDTAATFSIGDVIEYQVQGRIGGPANVGPWGNVDGVTWGGPFRIVSVEFVNNGATLGTLEVGDQIVVTFSHEADFSNLTATTVNIATRRRLRAPNANQANRRVFQWTTANNFFGGNATYAGASPTAGTGMTWTWTSSVNGTTMGVPAAAITPGTAVTCAANTAIATSTAFTPVPTGQW